MKKNKVHILMTIILLFTLVFVTSCSDGKSPESGYVSSDTIKSEVIDKIANVDYTKYSYEGTLQYLAYSEAIVPSSINKKDQEFIDSKEKFDSKCVSYYLSVPLHITQKNWIIYTNDNIDDNLSTKNRLEAKIYQPRGGYLDEVYYYLRDGGGFYIKSFGVNKALKIDNPSGVTAHGKWNIVIEYDANGFLVSESFETLNAHKEEDSKTIYGSCKYSFGN